MGTENMLNWAQAQSRADGCEPSHYRDIENPPEPIYGLFKAAAEAWRAVRHAAGNGAGIALSHPAVVVAEAAETAAWAAYEAAARELATAAETAGGVVEGEWIPPVNEGEAQSWGYTATRFGALLIAGVERQWALTAANGGG
ncbi:hypothetical protein COT78_00515 [Candidatus Berkelbacteria bacterium CG10_big_fil_rev_8_21_14_0_10_43_13]|uniref:Uncharacterized protein n=1 Tax=Candidatus Berkelbacteria bacterium CG10_big_fil_rev_8_21_14_0_10_43_13 TaxID=1974514 RepID=A0A2H0W9I1_9BACT|nr:MAG: hypothetical protein COT78_00515 [Candidatus Berkelbacteria bacterium CG10_big_fil_rev_8_21_14_0_10_43_13]